jgi:hypothetical protein
MATRGADMATRRFPVLALAVALIIPVAGFAQRPTTLTGPRLVVRLEC